MKTTLHSVLCLFLILSGSLVFGQRPVSRITQMLNHESKLNKARPTGTQAPESKNYRWEIPSEIWHHFSNTTYTYDTAGNIIEELQTDPSTNGNVSRVVRVFDTQGNEIERRSENWSNGNWVILFGNKSIYTYDNNDLEIEEIYQEWDNGIWVNEYKANYFVNQGVWESVTYQTWNSGSWMNSDRYIDLVWHDFEKRQIESGILEYYDSSNWVLEGKFTRTFDSNGGFQEIIQIYDNGSWLDDYRSTERFDSQGNITEDTDESWTGSEWEIDFQELITYTYSSSDELLTRMRQTYDFFRNALIRRDSIVYGRFSVGFEDLPELSNTSLFPNPTTTDFTIKVDDQDVQALYINVSDLNGRTLINQSNLGNKAILKTDALATGVYMVTITSNDKRTTRQKLVKY